MQTHTHTCMRLNSDCPYNEQCRSENACHTNGDKCNAIRCNVQCNNNTIQVAKCQKPKRKATEKCPTCNQSKCNRNAAPTSARAICCNLQHNRKRQQSKADQPISGSILPPLLILVKYYLVLWIFAFFTHLPLFFLLLRCFFFY